MNKARLLLKYIEPYSWSAFRNIIYNILSALFALISYTLVIPFLQILFDRVGTAPDPGEFQLNLDYLGKAARYYLYEFIDSYGESGR
jgi:subfamily B ATP-binding cassette protein MsbA